MAGGRGGAGRGGVVVGPAVGADAGVAPRGGGSVLDRPAGGATGGIELRCSPVPAAGRTGADVPELPEVGAPRGGATGAGRPVIDDGEVLDAACPDGR